MLNKNQSNKRNSWKYLFVLPILAAFVFFFQVKVAAQEKVLVEQEITNAETPVFILIEKNTSDKKFKEYLNLLEPNYGVKLKFSKIKRNSNGEIIAIKTTYTTKDGRSGATEMAGNKPIKTFCFYIKGDEMGFEELNNSKNNGNVKVSKTPFPTKDVEKPIIFLNGKKTNTSLEELNKTDQNLIQSINIWKGKNALKKYGKDGENGVIEIVTKENVDLLKSASANVNKEVTKLEIMVDHQPKTAPSTKNNGWELNYEISDSKDNITRIKEDKNVDYKQAIIFIDGKLSDSQTLEKLDPEDIAMVGVQKTSNYPQSEQQGIIKKYGEKALNGVITIETKVHTNLSNPSPNKTKKESELDKSDIDNSKNETVFSKERWLETYKTVWKARFFLKQMNAKKEQAKVELEKSKKVLGSKLFTS